MTLKVYDPRPFLGSYLHISRHEALDEKGYAEKHEIICRSNRPNVTTEFFTFLKKR